MKQESGKRIDVKVTFEMRCFKDIVNFKNHIEK